MEQLILQRAFIITLIVIAIWATMLPNMIFGKIRDVVMSEWLASPIYDCPICMIPYYGSLFYLIFFRSSWIEWFLVILVGMGIATIFVKIKKN